MADDFAKLIGRLTVGGLVLCHGIFHLLNGIAPVARMLSAHHLPETLSYGLYLGEVVGPLLVIAGFLARLGGVLIAADLATAIFLAKLPDMLALKPGGGYALELETLFLAGGLCIAFSGAGRFSVAGAEAPLN